MTNTTKTIPKGYKQTEIGVIPADWDVTQFRNTLSKVIDNRGKTPPYKNDSDHELIETSSISFVGQYPDYSKVTKFVTKDVFRDWFRDHPKSGDILISTVGEYSGASAIMKEDRGTVAQNLVALRIKNINPNFVFYWTRSDFFRKQLNQVMMSQAQPSLRVPWLLDFYLAFPQNPDEQISIATTLSDIDALIQKTENLIEKKKAIRQGAMQELLTGKKRLPGFSGEWEEAPISRFTWFQEGPGVRTEQFTRSGVKLLNGTNIYKGKLLLDNTNRFISESEAFGPYSHFLVDEEDIVIASSGITVDKFEEKISFVKKSHLPLCMNTSTIRFKILNNSMDPLFLYYFFMSKKFKSQIGAQATGSAQLNFGPSHLEKVDIYLPKDKKEQTAIATILSDMDTEIEKLESELTKWRDMKQGMMQTLLTGKIRLIK